MSKRLLLLVIVVGLGTSVVQVARAQPLEDLKSVLVGSWVNDGSDRLSMAISRLEITRQNGKYVIWAWGSCEPEDCEWGATELVVFDKPFRQKFRGPEPQLQPWPYGMCTYEKGFNTTHVTLEYGEGKLETQTFILSKANMRITDTFKRSESIESTAAVLQQRGNTANASQSTQREWLLVLGLAMFAVIGMVVLWRLVPRRGPSE